jgi:hypothetical protein
MVASPDWKNLCHGKGIAIEEDGVVITFSNGRKQKVEVRDSADTYELFGVVAKPGILEKISDVPLLAWRKNRGSQLVGFRVDKKGRLVGEAWVPKIGLEVEEFQLYLHCVAAECDHFEYLLTGTDIN